MKTIKIKIPATTSNFGSGYDVLGAARKLYNEFEVDYEPSNKSECVNLEISGEGEYELPRNNKNIICKTLLFALNKLKTGKYRFEIKSINRIPLTKGLGSSASARLAGLIAANRICNNKLSEKEILEIATKLEGHPDNIVPALFGGLCICNFDEKNVIYNKIKMPNDLKAVFCVPDFEISTDNARKILPDKVFLKDAVFNSGRVGFFISAINQKKYELLSIAMDDKIHQPYRKKLIPGADKVFKSAIKSGAYGVCISGSGPTILAISNKRFELRIGKAMQKEFSEHRINSKIIICDFDNEGFKYA